MPEVGRLRKRSRGTVLLGGLLLLAPSPAAAAAAPVTSSGSATSAPATSAPATSGPATSGPATSGPATRCQVTDPDLAEISGLVVLGERFLVLNDGGDRVAVHVLDDRCEVVDVRTAEVDPYDPEDLALAVDGTLWVADIGDNAAGRSTVALHALRADGTASLYRLAYPDGAHDAEALLLAPDGTPYLVTKEVLGSSAVYRPTAPLAEGATVGLQKVATVNVTLTGTPGGPVGRAGQLMITGGAVSGDGGLLALRTYTDAYVWTLQGSDVPAALAAEPVRVALPPSPQGEAISFAADHRTLVVTGEGLPADVVLVPTDTALAPVVAALPAEDRTAFADDRSGAVQTPVVSGIIAAAVATLALWVGGLWRRRWL